MKVKRVKEEYIEEVLWKEVKRINYPVDDDTSSISEN